MAAKPADTNGKIRTLTRDQSRRMFDRQARRLFHMSGQEFVKRFESGKFGDPDDRLLRFGCGVPIETS